MTYLREGERGFQDSEHYKSWHVVYYHRLIRFFAGGQVIMVTTSENPATAVIFKDFTTIQFLKIHFFLSVLRLNF